ncbi:TPA: HAD-IIIA family hydrolase [Campylobacter lari]|nr:HAD-IIIA family hydrolase [Campylobacter lari]
MKIVGVIPAKGNSSRTVNKNRQTILNVPLFLWAANNLNRILDKSDIYIDSDSKEILKLAKYYGFSIIERPFELATNSTNGNELLQWEASNVKADIYIQHLPPMVFLKKETLIKGIDLILKDGYHSAFGVVKEQLYLWNDKGPLYDLYNIPNSFTLQKTIIEGMGIYFTTRDFLNNFGLRINQESAIIELDKYEAIDIDYPEDLEFARSVAKGLGYNSDYTNGIDRLFSKKNIKLLILDVDGVMTDGGMYYSSTNSQYKKFNTKDGLAIRKIKEDTNINIAFLSSGENLEIIQDRAKTLNVQMVYVGNSKKELILEKWIKELGITFEEVAYIGDDINDFNAMKLCGLKVCPQDAVDEIKNISDIILQNNGGQGCVREFIDKFLISTKKGNKC